MATTLTKKPKPIGVADPAHVPCYALKEAAHHLRIARTDVRSWFSDGKHAAVEPLWALADPKTPSFSFRDLVELHMISAIRRKHPIHLPAVRKAIRLLRKTCHTQYPLSSREMLTGGGDLLLESFGAISDQERLKVNDVLDVFIQRIVRNRIGLPIRLYPFTRFDIHHAPRVVAIDPHIQFGRPCITGTRITTEIVMERYLAGESMQELASDYGCPTQSVEEAIRFETAV